MDNRQSLLNYALDLFSARGYDAVGVQQIVAAAGVTKPTLYHYFGSKSGLLAALFQQHFEPFLQSLRDAARFKGDVTMTLRTVCGAYFAFAAAHPQAYRLYLSMLYAAPHSEPFRVSHALSLEQQRLLEGLFASAAEHHGNLRGRQRAYAASLLGMINAYVTLSLNSGAELDDSLVYAVVQQFMYGIFS